jgi:hypothetical protein
VTQDDLLYRFRLRVFAMARSLAMSGPPVGRWDPSLDLLPLEAAAGPPRTADPAAQSAAGAADGEPDQRAGRAAGVAFALGHPGFGPARIAAELARPKWGGIRLSTNRVWRVLRRHGLNTRAKR